MNEVCTYDSWAVWLMIGLVAVTAAIVFVSTWTYWDARYKMLLREQASDDRARLQQTQNIRIREATYRNVTMGDLERDEP